LIGGYKDIFKNQTTKKYKDGTKFEEIMELYYFDEQLRELFLKYLIKVENQVKSLVSYYFTKKYGEKQEEYLNVHNYNYKGKKNIWDVDRLVKTMEGYTTKQTGTNFNGYGKV
jgi:abortive infection bacteriophage resistance protein